MSSRITIITVNYNNRDGLSKTISSVIKQTKPPYQYIIVDGASDDGSRELLSENSKLGYEWVSEKDKGIYNAMNKGIAKANGDYLLFLNSGDYFVHDTILEKVSPQLNEDLVYGDIVFLEDNKQRTVRFPSQLPFSFFLKGLNSLPHPCTFINKALFDKAGYYNESHSIVSDWTFFILALHKYNCTYRHLDLEVAVFNLNGVSSDSKNISMIKKERDEVLHKYFPTYIDDYNRLYQLETDMRIWRNHWLGKIYQRLIKGKFLHF